MCRDITFTGGFHAQRQPRAFPGCFEREEGSDEHHSLGCEIHTCVHIRGQTQMVTDAKAELKRDFNSLLKAKNGQVLCWNFSAFKSRP